MADFLIGTWKGDHATSTGMKEFMEAIGQKDIFDNLGQGIMTAVISKVANNKYLREDSVEGTSIVYKEEINIGEKVRQNFPFIGEVEMQYSLDGNKVVAKATHNGADMTISRHVEGNNLVETLQTGNIKCVMKFSKV